MPKVYTLKKTQFIPISIDRAWEFFSTPVNLQKITPDNMGFEIISDFNAQQKMHSGMIIQYHVSPLLGLKMHWVTEITHVVDKQFFVDEQRFGPYALWHHQHHFKQVDGGVEMYDEVNYAIGFSFLGRLLNKLFIAKKIESIFEYRFKFVEEFFDKKT